MNLSAYLGNAVTRVWKDISGSRIRTPLGKWDLPKSPQGYCRAVADLDFQIRGGGGEPVSNEFGIRVGREKGAGMRAEDTSPPRLLADPELPPLFHFLNFGKRKQYLIHPHQRQQKQQIVFRFNI